MAKKGVTKKKKASTKKKTSSKQTNKENFEKKLIENFVGLQRVMTNLSEKFETLSGNMSELLKLFEDSARALAKKDFEIGRDNKHNIEMLSRIDKLLEQNKIIAKGITLMHDSSGSNFSPPTAPVQTFPKTLEDKGGKLNPLFGKQKQIGFKKPRVEEKEDENPTFVMPE